MHLLALSLLCTVTFVGSPDCLTDTIPVPDAVRQAYARGTRNPDGSPGRRYWQISPEYDLTARLDPQEATVYGRGTLAFVNASPDPMHEIVLRLDQNRFRAGSRSPVTTRGIDLRQLIIDGDTIALRSERVRGLGTTVLRVTLPRPLEPGQRITVRSAWDYEVPLDERSQALRQGRWGTDVFQLAQWYPRLAMYDDLGGWDTTPHDGPLEFYNPFSRFAVQLTVPTGWLVGATGTLRNAELVLGPTTLHRLHVAKAADTTLTIVGIRERGAESLRPSAGEVTWIFSADSVSDFAWGTSSRYEWAATSRMVGDRRLLVHAFMTEKHRDSMLAGSTAAAEAIAVLSNRLMPYAWESHTLLDGPEGGMEYPGVTFSHGDGIAHEIAHQWFPMMVGTDETRFSFLDEGFATFLPLVIRAAPLAAVHAEGPAMAPLLLANDLRTPRMVLGYVRGSRMLQALAAQTDGPRLLGALRAYATAWRFKHPTPWDFMASMERSLGQRLDGFWMRWLFSAERVSP